MWVLTGALVIASSVALVAVFLCLLPNRTAHTFGTAMLCLWPGILSFPLSKWMVLGGPLAGAVTLASSASDGGWFGWPPLILGGAVACFTAVRLARGRKGTRLAVLAGAAAGYCVAIMAAQIAVSATLQITSRALPGSWHCLQATPVPLMVWHGNDGRFNTHATVFTDKGIWFWSFAEAGWVRATPNQYWTTPRMDRDYAACAARHQGS